MRVEVSGKQFVFPRSCACCGAYAVTQLTVLGTERNRNARTKGWTWDIPYCLRCKRHVRLIERLSLSTLTASAVAVVAGVAVGLLASSWQTGLGTVIVSESFVAIACYFGYRYVNGDRVFNCCGLTRSVLYLGSSGSCHSFDIKSHFFATEFILSNHRKIVNASVEVASILRNTEFGNYQVPRRVLKRKREMRLRR